MWGRLTAESSTEANWILLLPRTKENSTETGWTSNDYRDTFNRKTFKFAYSRFASDKAGRGGKNKYLNARNFCHQITFLRFAPARDVSRDSRTEKSGNFSGQAGKKRDTIHAAGDNRANLEEGNAIAFSPRARARWNARCFIQTSPGELNSDELKWKEKRIDGNPFRKTMNSESLPPDRIAKNKYLPALIDPSRLSFAEEARSRLPDRRQSVMFSQRKIEFRRKSCRGTLLTSLPPPSRPAMNKDCGVLFNL